MQGLRIAPEQWVVLNCFNMSCSNNIIVHSFFGNRVVLDTTSMVHRTACWLSRSELLMQSHRTLLDS